MEQQLQSAGVWVNATDKLPEPFKVVPCKFTPDSPDPRKDTELHWGFVSKSGTWDRQWSHYQVEWLDESPTVQPNPVNIDELWDEHSELIDGNIDDLNRWAGSTVMDRNSFEKAIAQVPAQPNKKNLDKC